MHQRKRESSKRSQHLRLNGHRVINSSISKEKSQKLNPVEKRNQRIEESKKKSQRVNNRPKYSKFENANNYKEKRRSRRFVNKSKNHLKEESLNSMAIQKDKSRPTHSRRIGGIMFIKDFAPSKFMFFGVGIVFALIAFLFSSFDAVLSEGVFFIYLGLLLLKKPSIQSQGAIIDCFAIILILYAACAFLPSFQFFYPEWRKEALNQYGLCFGSFHTIMPLRSLESFLILVASIIFYYHIACWKINNRGRGVLLIFIISFSLLAGIIEFFIGNDALGSLFPKGFERSPINYYSGNLNFLHLLGGLASVSLFFDFLKYNKFVSVTGFLGIMLSIFLLIYKGTPVNLLLFYGLSFLLIFRLYLKDKNIKEKYLVIISLLLFFAIFFHLNKEWLILILNDAGISFIDTFRRLWVLILGSIKELNIFGHGIGTAHSILPQLSFLEHYKSNFSYRGAYLLYFISDFGLMGFTALIALISYWIFKYKSASVSLNIRHRFIYFLIVFAFILRFLVSSEGTSIGLLIIFLISLNLSLRIHKDNVSIVSKKFCQILGIFLLFIGIFWIVASIANRPLLSDIRNRLCLIDEFDHKYQIDEFSNAYSKIDLALMSNANRDKYFLEAYQLIQSNADVQELARTLNKATLIDPNNSEVLLYLGYIFSNYDVNLAVNTWYDYFMNGSLAKLEDFIILIHYAIHNYELLLGIERISNLSNEYAVEYALKLNDLDFKKYVEVNSIELTSLSNKGSIFQFLKRLLEEGFFEHYNDYVAKNGEDIKNLILLEAIKQKELANFDEAISILRENLQPERIDINKDHEHNKYIPRVFMQNYPDLEMGMILIKNEIGQKNYNNALIYIDHILSMDNPPIYAYYWKAELLYQIRDKVESWFAFMTYLEKVNFQPFTK